MGQLHDISEVCSFLGTTSRTLRFYEQEGLIKSTLIPPSARRRYDAEQIEKIKYILALRKLGLPIKAIKELNRAETSLKDAVIAHRAEILCMISDMQRELNLLEEVLHDKKDRLIPKTQIECTQRQLEIAEICIDNILREDYGACIQYFSRDMKVLLPAEALEYSFKMAQEPVGAFVGKGEMKRSPTAPNVVIQILKYEKMSLRMKFTFHGDIIYGLWTDYVR